MLCHFLIGIPASGKSTFAQLLAQTGDYQIISTDAIRQELYGDENIQGNWLEIEAKVFKQIKDTIALNRGIIYDATNIKRAWRIDFLEKIAQQVNNIDWLAWYLNLNFTLCQRQNKQRERKVPETIIEQMAENIKLFPPHVAEGFVHVHVIKNNNDFTVNLINKIVDKLPRIITNRRNKTNNPNLVYHRYSRLVDFERLMHLISLLINYPALGNLQFEYPQLIQHIFGEEKTFPDSLTEITAILARLKGNIYAKPELIQQDLIFLESQELIYHHDTNINQINTNLEVVEYERIITHYASEQKTFQRILNTFRIISHYPFSPQLDHNFLAQIYTGGKPLDNGYLTSLAYQLIDYEELGDFELKNRRDLLRKDIEFIFNPYQIFPQSPMRNGYFFGTGILTQQELKQTFDLLQSQAKNIDDPLAIELFHKFHERLKRSKISKDSSPYPLRAIANHSFIDKDLLDSKALSNKVTEVGEIIEEGRLVELCKFSSSPSYETGEKGIFKAWLLQIVFYNFAWYLGFEQYGGEKNGLISFERLDRLYLVQKCEETRSLREQKKALNKLTKLLSASAGIYLGDSAEAQKAFLSTDKKQRQTVETKVELWFNEQIFAFIAEGTKRFPKTQMKMTKHPKYSSQVTEGKSIFTLGTSKDKTKPYRFQVILPQWSLDDFDLWRWILGFGGNVKVHKPDKLRNTIIQLSTESINVYQDG